MSKTSNSRKRKRAQRRHARVNARVLLSMTGRGIKDGWVTIQLPARLVICLVVGVLLIGIALIASPELAAKIAAKIGAFLTQLLASQKP